MKVGFVGLSHLGIVSSIAAASKGVDVIAFDFDAELCSRLAQGEFPIFELGLEDLLQKNGEHIQFVADPEFLQQCDLVYFSIDVSTDEDNRSDLNALSELIERTVKYLSTGCVLVILSQVHPGFTREIALRLAVEQRDLELRVLYQVETLIFGRAVERALFPERFIVGCPDIDLALPDIYKDYLSAYSCPILPMRYESAELAKISINICLAASISAANTLAEICENIGADWSEIVPALRLDQRIGPQAYIKPGLGIAGGNLERDLMTVKMLADERQTEAGTIDAWLKNSNHRRNWPSDIIREKNLAPEDDAIIAIWGLAYKEGTTSTKNSPALSLVRSLNRRSLKAYDPMVKLGRDDAWRYLTQEPTALDACRDASVLVVMTPWSEFTRVDLASVAEVMRNRVVVDPFSLLDAKACAVLGFEIYQIGVGALDGLRAEAP